MRIYISGAMTSDQNYKEKFDVAEEWVLGKYPCAEIVNPVRLSRELEKKWCAKPDSLPRAEYLKKDISELVKCDRLVAIPGFEKSAGAMLKINIALALNQVVEQISGKDFNIAFGYWKEHGK